MFDRVERDGLTIMIHRYGFGPGYYAEARNTEGKRLSFTGVYRGLGSRERAIQAAIYEATHDDHAPGNIGCPG